MLSTVNSFSKFPISLNNSGMLPCCDKYRYFSITTWWLLLLPQNSHSLLLWQYHSNANSIEKNGLDTLATSSLQTLTLDAWHITSKDANIQLRSEVLSHPCTQQHCIYLLIPCFIQRGIYSPTSNLCLMQHSHTLQTHEAGISGVTAATHFSTAQNEYIGI